MKIALVGNPNAGKTTLFNALTGARQRVGNWPGVTVERKSGQCSLQGKTVELVDLPGVYSLVVADNETAVDERIASDYLRSHDADVIINIVDAANLERNLYLTSQCLDLGVPMVMALNMMDVARQQRINIDYLQLSQQLGIPVIPIEAHKQRGLDALEDAIVEQAKVNTPISPCPLPESIQRLQRSLASTISSAQASLLALRALEGDIRGGYALHFDDSDTSSDILIADARYQWIHTLCQHVIQRASQRRLSLTARIDHWVLHRVLGIPIFFAVMYAMFLFAINIGGVFQDFVDISTAAVFVEGSAHALQNLHAPTWLIATLSSGVGKGINTTLTFVPVIGAMFMFLAFLESSGYMARAAFVMDRCMRALGLPGKAFVPMIVGFGCNVPAIMAARTLENKRDRILTIMMSPFMACSARLAIFAVFASAFFPQGGQNIVFALYLLGIGTAVLTGLLLRKTLLPGEPAPLVMELPPYHCPRLSCLWQSAWLRLQRFLTRASKVIIPLCMVLGVLNSVTLQGGLSFADANQQSLLSWLGRCVTPLFAPMGIHADNWPATVGLLTGTLAKEVVVATLNSLYMQVSHMHVMLSHSFDFWDSMHAAVMSIPENIAKLPSALFNPVLASAPEHTMDQAVYGVMYHAFASQAAAFAYLVFVLLYVPCVSTMAVIRRELSQAWMWFAIIWSIGLAYLLAVIVYQTLTMTQHRASSLMWISSAVAIIIITLLSMRRIGQERVSTC